MGKKKIQYMGFEGHKKQGAGNYISTIAKNQCFFGLFQKDLIRSGCFSRSVALSSFSTCHQKNQCPDVASCRSNSFSFPCFEIHRSQSVNEYTVWIWEIKNFRMKKHAYGRCFGTVLCSKCCVEVQITIKFYIET
jgi:hypothetical protein